MLIAGIVWSFELPELDVPTRLTVGMLISRLAVLTSRFWIDWWLDPSCREVLLRGSKLMDAPPLRMGGCEGKDVCWQILPCGQDSYCMIDAHGPLPRALQISDASSDCSCALQEP